MFNGNSDDTLSCGSDENDPLVPEEGAIYGSPSRHRVLELIHFKPFAKLLHFETTKTTLKKKASIIVDGKVHTRHFWSTVLSFLDAKEIVGLRFCSRDLKLIIDAILKLAINRYPDISNKISKTNVAPDELERIAISMAVGLSANNAIDALLKKSVTASPRASGTDTTIQKYFFLLLLAMLIYVVLSVLWGTAGAYSVKAVSPKGNSTNPQQSTMDYPQVSPLCCDLPQGNQTLSLPAAIGILFGITGFIGCGVPLTFICFALAIFLKPTLENLCKYDQNVENTSSSSPPWLSSEFIQQIQQEIKENKNNYVNWYNVFKPNKPSKEYIDWVKTMENLDHEVRITIQNTETVKI